MAERYTYRHRVTVAGTLINEQVAAAPRIARALDQVSARCTITTIEWPSVAIPGAPLIVEEAINDGAFVRTYTGEIYQSPERADFPPSGTLVALDALWHTTIPAPDALAWVSTDDAEVISDLLSAAGVPLGGILSSGWTLGTEKPVVLAAGATYWSLIQQIDQLAGYRTFVDAYGLAQRIPLPLYPGAAENVTTAYADNPTGSERGIYSAATGGRGVDAIRNMIIVQGLDASGWHAVEDQPLTAAFGSALSLWFDDTANLVLTDSDGTTTYAEGTDYTYDDFAGELTLVDPAPTIQAGDTLLASYDYQLADGLYSATLRAPNNYLRNGEYVSLRVQSDLIQSFAKATEIATALAAQENRLHVATTLTARRELDERVGSTITLRDADVLSTSSAVPLQVTAIEAQGHLVTIRAIGGDGGEIGYLDPRPPIARFAWRGLVLPDDDTRIVECDGGASFDLDGDLASYSWSDDRGNTGTGETFTQSYSLAAGDTVAVSLQCTDSTGLTSAVYTRTIDLTLTDDDVSSGAWVWLTLVSWRTGTAGAALVDPATGTETGTGNDYYISVQRDGRTSSSYRVGVATQPYYPDGQGNPSIEPYGARPILAPPLLSSASWITDGVRYMGTRYLGDETGWRPLGMAADYGSYQGASAHFAIATAPTHAVAFMATHTGHYFSGRSETDSDTIYWKRVRLEYTGTYPLDAPLAAGTLSDSTYGAIPIGFDANDQASEATNHNALAWINPADDRHVQYLTETALLEMSDGLSFSALLDVPSGFTFHALARGDDRTGCLLAEATTEPLILDNGERPTFPETITGATLTAVPGENTWLINMQWKAAWDGSNWTISSLSLATLAATASEASVAAFDVVDLPELAVSVDSVTADNGATDLVEGVDYTYTEANDGGGTWYTEVTFYSAFSNVDINYQYTEFTSLHAAWGHDMTEFGNAALRMVGHPRFGQVFLISAAEAQFTQSTVVATVLTGNTLAYAGEVSVLSHPSLIDDTLAWVTPVETVSDTSTKLLVQAAEPSGWAATDYDDSAWSAASTV